MTAFWSLASYDMIFHNFDQISILQAALLGHPSVTIEKNFEVTTTLVTTKKRHFSELFQFWQRDDTN